MSKTMLVRIKPDSPRVVHVFQGRTFKKEAGYYRVPEALAQLCKDEPLHDSEPEGKKLFDVVEDQEVAREAAKAAEAKKEAGSIDRPRTLEGGAPEPTSTEPAPPARVGGGAGKGRAASAAASDGDSGGDK
jgi:hypothetical protein